MIDHLLSLIVFIPLLGAGVVLFLKPDQSAIIKGTTLFLNVVQLLACIILVILFQKQTDAASITTNFQFVEKYEWIRLNLGESLRFIIEYHIGVDGISLPLVVLSSFLMLVAIISSWNQSKQVKGYFVLYNILNASIVGCFVALDFFLFYLFFELMLLPMFFLIGIWGGPNRSYASVKFFLYTLLGSILILIVMIGLYLGVTQPGSTIHTFNIIHMMGTENFVQDSLLRPGAGGTIFGIAARYAAFLALFVGFAIKLPMVPVHTWLPDAHVEAPTAISVILAGLLLKVGGYGIVRIAYGIFPDAALNYAYLIAVFGVISIVYGGLNALAQRDLKRMIAYSSVSHMGFVLVGLGALTVEGVSGAVFHMVSHGLISGALFLIAGVIYDRTGDRLIDNYSGLAGKLPQYTFVVVFMFFASLGLPGLSGFIGEILVLMGAFDSASSNGLLPPWIGVVSTTGIIISAAYYLWATQRMFFGEYWVREASWESNMHDISKREWTMFIPIMLLVLILGVYPRFLLDFTDNTVNQFVNYVLEVGANLMGK